MRQILKHGHYVKLVFGAFSKLDKRSEKFE